MLAACMNTALKFRAVLMDSRLAATKDFNFIVNKNKQFISALKDSRLVLREADKKQGRFARIDTLALTDKQTVRGWLKGYAHEGLLVSAGLYKSGRQHGLGEAGCNDWRATVAGKVFHQFLKTKATLAKSPTGRVLTRNNPVFMSIVAVFKLECLKLKHKACHFALRAKLFIKAPAGLCRTAQSVNCVTSVINPAPS